MASWLTHLRIAEKIKNKIKDIDLSYLLMGSIAPDLILSDAKYKTSLLENITSIKLEIDSNVLNYTITDFYNKYIHPEKLITRSDKTRSFLWGCYFHLMTKRDWIDEYYPKFKIEYDKQSGEPKQDMISFIKGEVFALDFQYLKQNDNKIVEELKNTNINLNYFFEFDTTYINEYKDKIIDFYSQEVASEYKDLEFHNLINIDNSICKISNKCIRALLY